MAQRGQKHNDEPGLMPTGGREHVLHGAHARPWGSAALLTGCDTRDPRAGGEVRCTHASLTLEHL